MAHRETNPHFAPPEFQQRDRQPLLPPEWEPRQQQHHPDQDPHAPPRHRSGHEPLGPWSGLTQHPPHDGHTPARHPQGHEPLGPWSALAPHPDGRSHDQQPGPKIKKKSRQGNGSRPPKTVAIAPLGDHGSRPPRTGAMAPPSDHHTINPSVPPPGHQGRVPPSSEHHPHLHRPEPSPLGSRLQPYLPKPRRTKLPTWFAAVCCAIFWIIIFIGGVTILLIYLVFHPRTPVFDITNATLNAANLTKGYFLNADLTLLATFTNPNEKATVDFSPMYVNLYFENHLIATQYLPSFRAAKREKMLANFHIISSQILLTFTESQILQKQIEENSVIFQLKGKFRARLHLGSLIRHSYWLETQCSFMVGSPPNGVLIGKKCTTKD